MPRKIGDPFRIDIVGKKFGRWVVVSRFAGAMWLCRCECGTEKPVTGSSLKRGASKSCGCYSRDITRKHGMEGTPTYNVWAHMLSRCRNQSHKQYADYGGRGITVCDDWLSFPQFLADMGKKPRGKSLDRIDNDGPYAPGNCRWATYKEQLRNQRRSSRVEFRGTVVSVADLAERHGITPKRLRDRLKAGMSVEDALEKGRINPWIARRTRQG